MVQKVITDDLDALMDILAPHIREPLSKDPDVKELLEVVLDLGRPPEARFPNRETVLSPREVTEDEIDYTVTRIGSFGDDNRAGIPRTLHRISAIRNRKGHVVGLTLRVGRAVFGTIKVIEDLIQQGKSVLLLGRPGVGKTTMLREVARVLSTDMGKRVIIVDTSNEIAGDGDIPHPAIGHARRMQVATPTMQHAVMIEAVENHMPQVIVIDEIGTELEAQAARTIAERGVQLVGTAHGNMLENLMMNPTLSDLVGGIQSVTLGDEEARRRGTQKSVLERKSPPTFDIVVEILDRDRVAIHRDVGEAVDAILRGKLVPTETRWLDEGGEVRTQTEVPAKKPIRGHLEEGEVPAASINRARSQEKSPRLYLFGVNRGRLEQMARERGLKVEIVASLSHSDLFVTSKGYFRRKLPKVAEAEAADIPIYVLKANTPPQIRQLLNSIFHTEPEKADPFHQALAEAEEAANRVKEGADDEVELEPQSAYIRRLQHLIAERNAVSSESAGSEPNRRVRIYKA